MGWLYVPGLEDLSSGCESRLEEVSVLSATLNGKPTRLPLSWRGWKTRPWIGRLFGTILRPSMAARGAEQWIALLQESRASLTASRDRKRVTRMSARSGRSSSESSRNASQLSFSLRMSRLSSNTSSQSGVAYQGWASRSHRRYYKPRRASERPTCENVSLSLLPTPIASQRGSRGQTSDGGEVLDAVIRLLPTPTAADYKASGAAGYSTQSGRHSGMTLTDAILGAASAGRIGKLNPRLSEWMQGFPAGWTNSAPLVTQSFQTWLQRRGLTS
jgi:hypothetical protein